MGKAMKAMKAPMKAKKAMKVSKIAKGKNARAVVFRGGKEKTATGMTKDKLMKNKAGRIVSKARSAAKKKAFATSAEAVERRWLLRCERQDRAGEGAVCQGQEHPWEVIGEVPFPGCVALWSYHKS